MAAPSAVPWIGSRISLISKSEIRYEGTLYTINAAESTVALENGGNPKPAKNVRILSPPYLLSMRT
jgi:hypothetical protein